MFGRERPHNGIILELNISVSNALSDSHEEESFDEVLRSFHSSMSYATHPVNVCDSTGVSRSKRTLLHLPIHGCTKKYVTIG